MTEEAHWDMLKSYMHYHLDKQSVDIQIYSNCWTYKTYILPKYEKPIYIHRLFWQESDLPWNVQLKHAVTYEYIPINIDLLFCIKIIYHTIILS